MVFLFVFSLCVKCNIILYKSCYLYQVSPILLKMVGQLMREYKVTVKNLFQRQTFKLSEKRHF